MAISMYRASAPVLARALRNLATVLRKGESCATERNCGTSRLQLSTAMGQRGWKTQPGGGRSGLGSSPLMMVRGRERSIAGSGIGAACRSALV